MKHDLHYEKNVCDKGTFWMPFNDFVKYFAVVDIAHTKDWHAQRFPIHLTKKKSPVIRFTLEQSTEMCFTLFQRTSHRERSDKIQLDFVVHCENSHPDVRGEMITFSERCYTFARTNDHVFEPGKYIVCALFSDDSKEISLPATMVMHRYVLFHNFRYFTVCFLVIMLFKTVRSSNILLSKKLGFFNGRFAYFL